MRNFVIMLFFIILSFPFSVSAEPMYVGSEACKECHEFEYQNFMRYAKKAMSYEKIVRLKKGLTKEEFQRCFQCHTTGYGKPSGFVSVEKTPELKFPGCEVCHGPGSEHIESQSIEDIKKPTLKDCASCHVAERIEAFEYKPMLYGGAH
ncbi:MAG: Cytochrome c554 and c-prime [Candidatus Methanoperedenaceae archaeon GB50]|nr:Cytochrome c554 and c-prime [Candidatus Methanoperedenaceae archaeon GB37]CAD7774011.1 MAG: Cytochrome c554 and c-prime [Candidatus Methanoperedenaceae archaeon GB50]CAD7783736.1 MAG: Cytochrome c554 and c-prime [Candidatus Methanoperedenaceae archaeon GB37]